MKTEEASKVDILERISSGFREEYTKGDSRQRLVLLDSAEAFHGHHGGVRGAVNYLRNINTRRARREPVDTPPVIEAPATVEPPVVEADPDDAPVDIEDLAESEPE